MLHIRLWSMRLIFTIFALAILLPCAAWARSSALASSSSDESHHEGNRMPTTTRRSSGTGGWTRAVPSACGW